MATHRSQPPPHSTTASATVDADSFLTTPDVVVLMAYLRVEGAREFGARLEHWHGRRGQIEGVATDGGSHGWSRDPVTVLDIVLDRWPL